MSYNVGQADLSIVPSFKGIAKAIDAEAAKWGESAGTVFGDAFNEAAKTGIKDPVPDEEGPATEKGSKAGGAFADAFKARVDAALKTLPDASVGVDASEFDAELADIRLELETLSNQRIGIDISDDEALAKLAELKLALVDIGHSSDSIEIKVNTASALTELAGLDVATAGSTALLDEMSSGGGGAGGGLSGLASAAEESGASVGGVLVPALAILASSLIPLVGLAAGVAGALGSIALVATGGLGALALAVVPLVTQVTTAYQKIQTYQTAFDTATTAKGKASAFASLENYIQSLSPFMATLVGDLEQAKGAFDKFAGAVQPQIVQLFGSAVSLLAPLFSALTPLAQATADVVSSLIGQFKTDIKSSAFGQDITWLITQIGPSLQTIFNVVTDVAQGLINMAKAGQPFTTMVIGWIDGAAKSFENFGKSKTFKDFIDWLVKNGPTIKGDVEGIVKDVIKLIVPFADFGIKALTTITKMMNLLVTFVTDLQTWGHDVEHWTDQVIGFFTRIPGQINHVWSDVVNAIHRAWSAVANWVETTVTDPVVGFFTSIPTRVHRYWSDVVSDIHAAWSDVANWVKSNVIDPVVGFFTAIPGDVHHIWSDVVNDLHTAWSDVANWVHDNVVSPVVDFFKGLGHDISQGIGDIASIIEGPFIDAFNFINNNIIKPLRSFFSWLTGQSGNSAPAVNPSGSANQGGAPNANYGGGIPTGNFRAAGGPVLAGVPYWVGELGPEMYVPEANGVILPMSLSQILGTVNLSPQLAGSGAPLFDHSVMHFHNEAEIQGLMRQASFYRKARRI